MRKPHLRFYDGHWHCGVSPFGFNSIGKTAESAYRIWESHYRVRP